VGREQVSEFLADKTLRASKAHATLEPSTTGVDPKRDSLLVKAAVQFVIDNVTGVDRTKVGGPIDVAIMRKSGGIEWISRKKECYKTDILPVRTTGFYTVPENDAAPLRVTLAVFSYLHRGFHPPIHVQPNRYSTLYFKRCGWIASVGVFGCN
jgi:hypothetical protein